MKHIKSFMESNDWIKDAVKNPGSLRKSMKKKKGEKISKSEIDDSIRKLKDKDKDPKKKGVQGLSKSELKRFRQLNLSKTLKGFKESSDNENYMFFANLENICSMVQDILKMDKSEIDEMLSDGHDWATDHISSSKESIEHVHDWLQSIK